MIRNLFSYGIILIFTLAFSTQADTSNTEASASDSISSTSTKADTGRSEKFFTLDELAGFDGSNGKPAYVAIDGIVYDLTPIKAWKKGKHHGHKAGFDLSEMLAKKSPHGMKVLKKLKAVGKVAEKK